MLEAEIVETGKQLAQHEQKSEELLAILKPHAGGQAAAAQAPGEPQQPLAAPNATLVPVAPGIIIHSNSVNHAELVAAMMQNPEGQNLGVASEAGATMVKLVLCQLQQVSMEVAPPSLAPAPVPDIQSVNMEADAELKRKANDSDD